MNRLNVRPTEALQIWDDLWVVAIGVELLIKLEVLEFSDSSLASQALATLH
jgi:hypothetical protein